MQKIDERYIEIHTAAAEVVLGAVLAHPELHLATVREALPDGELLPPTMSRAYEAALALLDEGIVITPETVADRANIHPDQLVLWATVYRDTPAEEIDADVQIITDRGRRLSAKRIGEALSEGRMDLSAASAELDRLTVYGGGSEGISAAQSDDDLTDLLGAGLVVQRRPLGLGVLDMWTYNMEQGKATGLLAESGGGKSRTMRNFILAAAARHVPVSVFVPDGDQDAFQQHFAADCIAMIAAQYLYVNSHIAISAGDKTPGKAWPLNGRSLINTQAWRQNPLLRGAVDRAREIWRTLPIMMYGPRQSDDPNKMLAEIRRDKHNRGKGLVALDYIQHPAIRWSGDTLFERAQSMARFVTMITREGHHALILEQKNQEAIRNSSSDAPGTLGGGSLDMTMDLMFSPVYDSEKTPGEILYKTPKNRDGARSRATYRVEPVTGLLLGWYSIAGGDRSLREIDIIPAQLLAPQAIRLPYMDDDGAPLEVES